MAAVDTAPAEEQAAPGHASEAELPRSIVQRIVKAKLSQTLAQSQTSKPGKDGEKKAPSAQVTKDALLAFQESGRVFINYLSSTANDFAKESKRVTISAEDVFKALDELEFTDFVEPLRQYLEAHKASLKEKPKKAGSGQGRKRKAETAAGEEAARQQPGSSAAAGEGEDEQEQHAANKENVDAEPDAEAE